MVCVFMIKNFFRLYFKSLSVVFKADKFAFGDNSASSTYALASYLFGKQNHKCRSGKKHKWGYLHFNCVGCRFFVIKYFTARIYHHTRLFNRQTYTVFKYFAYE